MGKQQISELLATLEMLQSIAGDVIDGVALARAEIEQTFEEIEQPFEGKVSA